MLNLYVFDHSRHLMRVSMPVRQTLALLAVTLSVSACSDATTHLAGPSTRTVKFEAAPELQLLAARHADDARAGHADMKNDDLDELTFTVDPTSSRTYAFGRNWIFVPAHAICDPATSSYGWGTWDLPCEPLDKPIEVTVRWKHRGGHGYVDFEPQLRFVPSSRIRDWVVLAIYDRKPLNSEDYRILWDADNGKWIDEAATDPTLRAYVDRRDNTVYRRIKHFSGYMITAGLDLGGLQDGGFYDAY